MNINAINHSLPNIITRTLMGRREKRPTFDEVYKTLSKNSAKLNSRMPLNSSLTNEQMYSWRQHNPIFLHRQYHHHVVVLIDVLGAQVQRQSVTDMRGKDNRRLLSVPRRTDRSYAVTGAKGVHV